MNEADRPPEERLSVLDRPRTDADRLPLHPQVAPARHWEERVEEQRIRLALTVGDLRIWVAPGRSGDDVYKFCFGPDGGGISGGPRSVLRTHGASISSSTSSHDPRHIVWGIVPDPVTAVRVGAVDAIIGDNAFLAVVPGRVDDLVLSTVDGERVVSLRSKRLPNANRPPARPGGYVGQVEYAVSGYPTIDIDDLDSPNWTGALFGAFVLKGNTPDRWFVGVILLEGPRAGEFATAELVVGHDEDGRTRTARFEGRTPFGPHPESSGLVDARRRLADLERRLDLDL